MVVEDFRDYMEVDPAAYISATETRATYTLMPANVDAYLYKDLFYEPKNTHNFVWYVEGYMNSAGVGASESLCAIGLQNVVDDSNLPLSGMHVYLRSGPNYQISIGTTGPPIATDITAAGLLAADTLYYLIIKKYWTNFSVEIYSDANRTNLLDMLSVSTPDIPRRYLFCCQSYNTGLNGARHSSGYWQNFDWREEPLKPSLEPLTGGGSPNNLAKTTPKEIFCC